MNIKNTNFSMTQLSQFLYHKNDTCIQSCAVWVKRAKAYLDTGRWLNSQNLFAILSQNPRIEKKIPFIFKNAKVCPALAEKLQALAKPLMPSLPKSSLPKILLNALNETGNRTHYNPQGRSIRERRPALFEFLNNPHFKHTQSDYDFGYEDEFSVVWIDPKNRQDADLIDRFRKKYEKSLHLLDELNHAARLHPPMSTTETTRFANNDTFGFLNFGKTHPVAKQMMRDIMIWAATREVCRIKNIAFPHKEVIDTIFN